MPEQTTRTVLTPEGDVNVTMETIKTIGVYNIGDIANYTITNEAGKITHRGEFKGGGHFLMSYDSVTGIVDEISANNATMFTRGTAVFFAKFGETPTI